MQHRARKEAGWLDGSPKGDALNLSRLLVEAPSETRQDRGIVRVHCPNRQGLCQAGLE